MLEVELEAVGIRLNRDRPDVVIKTKNGGGVTITATSALSYPITVVFMLIAERIGYP